MLRNVEVQWKACSLEVREVSLEEGRLELGLKDKAGIRHAGRRFSAREQQGQRQGWRTRVANHSTGWGENRVPSAHVSAVLPGSHPLALSLSLAPVGTEASILVPLKVWPEKHWIPFPVHDKNKYIN